MLSAPVLLSPERHTLARATVGCGVTRPPAIRSRALLLAIVLGLLVDGWLAANGALWYRTADFSCLREGARLLAIGADPYDPQAWRPVIEAVSPDPFRGSATSSCVARYASPLWTAMVMLPFGALPLELAAALWMALSIAGVVFGLHWIWAAIGGSARLAPVFAACVVASQPFWLLLVGGQVNGLLVGMLGGAVRLAASGRHEASGALLAALVIKPQVAGAFVPAMLARELLRGNSRPVRGAAAMAALLVGASLALRPDWPAGWLDEVGGRRLGYAGLLPSAWGLANDVLGTIAWAPVLIGAAVLSVALIVGGRPLDRVRFAALALPLSIFAMPHIWSYDFLVLALPWGIALALADRLAGARRTILLLATVFVASVLPWSLFAVGILRGQENWSAIVPVATALLVAAAHRLSNVRIISEPST